MTSTQLIPMRSVSLFALALLAVSADRAHSQQPARPTSGVVTLSLDDALRMVPSVSQAIDVARAGVVRASGGRYQARSQYFPQLNASIGYTKTLQSQFAALSKGSSSGSSSSTGSDTSKSGGGGIDFSKTSFGATNSWTGGLQFQQNIYTGGRIQAQTAAADAQLRSAGIEVTAQTSQAILDVASAYYDAVLTDQLVSIADSSVAQTSVLLEQAKVAKQVGNASEYELLRAQVTYQNQLPIAIQAKANRQTAYLRLKQLLSMPLDDELRLTTGIEGASGPTLPTGFSAPSDTSSANRAPVRQLDEAIHAQEAQVKIARAERIPSLAFVSAYQRLYFPAQVLPSLGAGVNNWTVGLSTNFPILDGGRIKGDQLVAQAGVQQARAQREQARELASLDSRVALTNLQEAQSSWDASRGTAEQAQRTYAIDEVRYREGISTQTDLTQSRLLLEQARANRAQAARNLAVARVKLALIRDLPLSASGGNPANAAVQGQQQQNAAQQAQQQQQRTIANPAAGTPGGPTGGSQP